MGAAAPGAGVPGWVPSGASAYVDAINDRAWINGTQYGSISDLIASADATFARASAKNALDASGAYQVFASGNPAITTLGWNIEGAVQNKCVHFNANPTDLTNVSTFDNGTGATFTVVDDSAALAAAGLDGICTSGKVFKIVGGTSSAGILVGGAVANTNIHSLSCLGRATSGTARMYLQSAYANRDETTSPAYSRLICENITPASSTRKITLEVDAGSTGYCIISQLEENAFISSPIVVAGAAATRQADALTLLPAAADYDIIFTFDDDSTQELSSETVTGSGFAVPTDLNRPVFKEVAFYGPLA